MSAIEWLRRATVSSLAVMWVKLASRSGMTFGQEGTAPAGPAQRSRKKVPAFFYDSSGTLERGTQRTRSVVKGRKKDDPAFSSASLFARWHEGKPMCQTPWNVET